MDDIFLRLNAYNRDPQELALQPHKLEASILDAAATSTSYVFCDHEYTATLVISDPQNVQNFQMLLNGFPVELSYFPDGSIRFQDPSFGARIFLECYGFVQLTISFNIGATSYNLETEYLHVMVRKGKQNDSIKRMTEYVYRKNKTLLYGNKLLPKTAVGLKPNAEKTLEARILLIKQISRVFEENYRYFKANSRFVTVPREHVDHFEKLQYISDKTVQYIVQHPEELKRSVSSFGIKIGNSRYHPYRTLVTTNEKSYDIYENRTIIGFLRLLLGEISHVESEISMHLSKVSQKPRETVDYITSTYFIYVNTISTLKTVLEDLHGLRQKYSNLLSAYTAILPCKKEDVRSLPKYTPLFRAVPQYHQVYECMISWFSMGIFTLKEETYMLSFLKTSVLYEVYVLAKLISYFNNAGFSLECCEQKIYPFSGQTFYENTACNNYFVFKKDSFTVTVYYQPVIYHNDKQSVSGIGLFRNTSISFPRVNDRSATGKYYTPDYLIKFESDLFEGAKYVIADAKFSTKHSVETRHLAELAYKYLFSISPLNATDQVVALCVFNGQSDHQTDSVSSAYDYSPNDNLISPKAEIVTLTENAEDNTELHTHLIKWAIGRYAMSSMQASTLQRALPKRDSLDATERVEAIVENIPTATVINGNTPHDLASDTNHTPSAAAAVPVQTNTIAKKKKSSHIKQQDKMSYHLADLGFSSILLDAFETQGLVTVADLVPNCRKTDLHSISILNRKQRREIEGVLKERKIKLI